MGAKEKEVKETEEVTETSEMPSIVSEEMKIEDIPENGEQRSIEEEIENRVKDKMNEALNKISELEDKLIRKDADMINFRKRKEEEVNRMLKFCNEDIIKEILPIIDNFERAVAVDESTLSDVEKNYLTGFKMIYTHLINVLEKFDVKAIDENNIEFNPVYHNAIMMEKKDGVKSGMVIEVLQKGYMLKDKVIRAAMVKVSE